MAYAPPTEYGLDAEHIQEVCRAETDDVNFTLVQRPDRMYVTSRYRAHDVLTVLRRVGYDAAYSQTNAGTVLVTGWSNARLEARITALQATAERLEKALPGTPARAIDAYTVRHDEPDIEAPGYQVASRLREHLRRDVQMVTGPHAPYQQHVAPADQHTESLVRRARRWERVVDDVIYRHWMAASDAIDAYRDLRAGLTGRTHADARRWAIEQARAGIAADPHRRTGGEGRHPAALASTDRPAQPPAREGRPGAEQPDTVGHHIADPPRRLALARSVQARGPAVR